MFSIVKGAQRETDNTRRLEHGVVGQVVDHVKLEAVTLLPVHRERRTLP